MCSVIIMALAEFRELSTNITTGIDYKIFMWQSISHLEANHTKDKYC